MAIQTQCRHRKTAKSLCCWVDFFSISFLYCRSIPLFFSSFVLLLFLPPSHVIQCSYTLTPLSFEFPLTFSQPVCFKRLLPRSLHFLWFSFSIGQVPLPTSHPYEASWYQHYSLSPVKGPLLIPLKLQQRRTGEYTPWVHAQLQKQLQRKGP